MSHPFPKWLDVVRHRRRGLKDIRRRSVSPAYIHSLATRKVYTYPDGSTYSLPYKQALVVRDKALIATIFLTAGRINEVLRISREQVDTESDEDFVVLRDFYVSKRKDVKIKKSGVVISTHRPEPTLLEIPIPKHKEAKLYPLSRLFFEHYNLHTRKGKLFAIKRQRAHAVIKNITGYWPHYFRSMAFSWYAKIIRSPYALAECFGVENVNTISRYFTGTWQDYRTQLTE